MAEWRSVDPSTAAGAGNDYTIGTRFRVDKTTTLTSLGWKFSAASGITRTLKIWDTTTGLAVWTLTISSCVNGWNWYSCPITLVANRTYVATFFGLGSAVYVYAADSLGTGSFYGATVGGVLCSYQDGYWYISGNAYPTGQSVSGVFTFAIGLRFPDPGRKILGALMSKVIGLVPKKLCGV